ncbi:CRISPR-associated exonuclease Cas4 [Clostridium saccharoperbutylacetonicum]|nr:CRISPR-associated exonuclease Cas4 [Clostridium saccharoperbutylacetonicum]NSB23972.1 CRISPR-associated exonuclease Cas4 [Clostridium saccharoperbutylacetonicum]NSB43348.1 CRISPR-associated exonuclease Cas4 [Clostridium saccharoperbutylacetonicum]
MLNIDFENLKVSGLKVDYYFICKRKLWLFDKGISMESANDRVMQGTVVHKESYKKAKTKELLIDNLIRLDIIDDNYVREVKITSRMRHADEMQLLYYLYYLKRLGIERKGTLNYVKEKKVEEVILTKENEALVEEALIGISELLQEKYPPKVEAYPHCSKCAYYEYCFVKEEE